MLIWLKTTCWNHTLVITYTSWVPENNLSLGYGVGKGVRVKWRYEQMSIVADKYEQFLALFSKWMHNENDFWGSSWGEEFTIYVKAQSQPSIFKYLIRWLQSQINVGVFSLNTWQMVFVVYPHNKSAICSIHFSCKPLSSYKTRESLSWIEYFKIANNI